MPHRTLSLNLLPFLRTGCALVTGTPGRTHRHFHGLIRAAARAR